MYSVKGKNLNIDCNNLTYFKIRNYVKLKISMQQIKNDCRGSHFLF